MATIYPNEQGGVAQSARSRPIARDAVTALHVIQATFNLTTNDHSADDFRMTLPKGFRPQLLGLFPSATLGSTTLAVGNSGTAGKYRAAATLTASALAPVVMGGDAVLSADEEVIIDPAAANLPASGTLCVRFYGTYGPHG